MKITFITNRYFPMQTADCTRISSFVKTAVERKHTVHVISCKNSKPLYGEIIHTTNSIPPKNTHRLVVRIIKEIILGVELAFKVLWHKTDVFVITSPGYIPALMCWTVAKIKKTPYICDIRDNYPNVMEDLGIIKPSNIILKLFYGLNKILFQSALRVSYVVPNDIMHMKKYNIDCLTVSNGYDDFKVKEHSKPKGKLNIIFHGSMGNMYNMDFLNQTAKIINNSNITFTAIGEGIGKKNLSSKYVKVLDKVSSDIIYSMLQDYHLGFFCLNENKSNVKCFPVKAYEYIGSNMPIITKDNNLCAEYIKQNNTGILVSTPEDTANEILSLYKNRTRYETMVKNIKKTKNTLSRQHQNTKLIDFIESNVNV